MFRKRVLTTLATAVLFVAGCTSSGGSAPTQVAAGSAAPGGVVVGATNTPSFGMVLSGPNGLTLYTHAGDSATASTCDGSCATAWPPLATKGSPTAGAGLTGALGTLTRPDGSVQVTYGGLPLYYWQGDTKAGDVTGNGVEGFSVAKVDASGSGANPPAPASTSPTKYGY
jgi:predicted lipoprotein with Yx(FWY)xxD motif